jgi:hypothetical protein
MSQFSTPIALLLAALAASPLASCRSKAPTANPPPTQTQSAAEEPSAPAVPAAGTASMQPVRAATSQNPGIPAGGQVVDGPTTPPAGNPSEDAEIQKQFLSTITSVIAKADVGLRTPRTTYLENNQPDTVYAEYAGTYAFDIRKSESIVAPLVGTVSWDIRWFHNGVQAPEAMTLDARYGYLSGKWVIQKLVRKVDGKEFLPADEYLPLFQ